MPGRRLQVGALGGRLTCKVTSQSLGRCLAQGATGATTSREAYLVGPEIESDACPEPTPPMPLARPGDTLPCVHDTQLR